ncbi:MULTISPECIES: hypothetical protein [unclassified Caballeronia]|uniref:hypothetical protein n=1 Tax=unclassified Caballeronia TaxID=2646786 RepID=UPI001F2CD618|nr:MULTISPECIES: hypothetical protein [unclassified Caballeronia]MCE4545271.1 hypothetical protein [Caballeronia sp. PC1]MCE4570697.1 hypothetical protein [Caballeronia sp. CLC5]
MAPFDAALCHFSNFDFECNYHAIRLNPELGEAPLVLAAPAHRRGARRHKDRTAIAHDRSGAVQHDARKNQLHRIAIRHLSKTDAHVGKGKEHV